MSGIFNSGQPDLDRAWGGQSSQAVQAPQIMYMPTDNSAEVKAAEERQRKAGVLAKGRSSTLLTGGAGVTDTATVQRKTLLGE